MTDAQRYQLEPAQTLEAEAIYIIREVAAEFERPVLLFSGGKDSIVMLRLAEKAFWPARIPFPVMHVDTGHNFPEVLDFRDRRVAELGVQLVVASVQEAIDAGTVVEPPDGTRNRLQTPVLLDAIEKHRFNAVFGGARRDEEKARAKERVFSFRDEFGQWDPKNQRPELWSLYNGRIHPGESIRVFPLSNWTELDIWQYIAREGIELPSIYFAHEREVFERDGMLLRRARVPAGPRPARRSFDREVRYRTVGDASLHRRRARPTPTRSSRSSTRSPPPGSPSAARPAATTSSARPRWKTASARGTSRWTCCGSPPPARSTTARAR